MNISAIQKLSFKSNTPIYHVYNTNQDNTVQELTSDEAKGPVEALVKRLNANDTDEFRFFSEYISDFASTPIATSTLIGSGGRIKSTVIYGNDAEEVNQLRRGHYKKKYYSRDDINESIYSDYIIPVGKRARHKETNQPLGLILHTKSKGRMFKLENVDIVDLRGRRIATLHEQPIADDSDMYFDQDCYEEYLQEKRLNQKKSEVYPPAPEELEEEFEDTDKYFASFKISDSSPKHKAKQKLVQGELFDCIA